MEQMTELEAECRHRYRVRSIREDDYGCEERPEGVWPTVLVELEDENGQLLPDEQRLFPLGRFLRSSSLHELPQLINVLKGEMSLVGPRPIIQDEIKKYGAFIKDFYMVRPGVTGMWQTSGRSDTTYEERVQMDTWYVRNWNVWFDIVLIWRTIAVVLKHKGAY